jgi:hypothetical protein
MEAALRMRGLTGLPNVLAILPEDFDEEQIFQTTEVYKEIFGRQKDARTFVRVVRDMEGLVPSMAESLSQDDTTSCVLGGAWLGAWRIVDALLEQISFLLKGLFTVVLGMTALVYTMVLALQNFSTLRSLADVNALLVDKFGTLVNALTSSGWGLSAFLLACFFTSTQLTAAANTALLIGRLRPIPGFLISRLIVFALCLGIIYTYLPLLSYSGYVLGSMACIAGFLLTFANDRNEVERAGSAYYLNDANRTCYKPQTGKGVNKTAAALQLTSNSKFQEAAAAGLSKYYEQSQGKQLPDFAGIGARDATLKTSEGLFMDILSAAQSISNMPCIVMAAEALGDIALFRGQYTDAIRYYRVCVATLSGHFQPILHQNERIAQFVNLLAQLYALTGDEAMAKQHTRIFKQSI